jgi:hypothetical protein
MKETRSGLSGGAQAPQAAAPTTAQLWETYGATHATEERNELLLRYIDLVRHVVAPLLQPVTKYEIAMRRDRPITPLKVRPRGGRQI